MILTDFAGIPRGRYCIIYADPPWGFKTWSAKGSGRGAVRHYPTLTSTELAAFPVTELAAKDCALLLWVCSNLGEALGLIRAWGFNLKSTGFTWMKSCQKNPMKPRIGLGKRTRSCMVQCRLATRGQPRRLRELIVAPIREHSRKPAEHL